MMYSMRTVFTRTRSYHPETKRGTKRLSLFFPPLLFLSLPSLSLSLFLALSFSSPSCMLGVVMPVRASLFFLHARANLSTYLLY